jgi:hypothetical protein
MGRGVVRCVLLRLRTTNLAIGVFLGRHALARHTTPKTPKIIPK